MIISEKGPEATLFSAFEAVSLSFEFPSLDDPAVWLFSAVSALPFTMFVFVRMKISVKGMPFIDMTKCSQSLFSKR